MDIVVVPLLPHLAGALDAVWIPHSGALEGPDSIDATDSQVTTAAILQFANDLKDQGPELETSKPPQEETVEEVKANPHEITGNDARERAYQKIKKRISESPILRLLDVTRTFILLAVALYIGIGAVILQEDCAGEKRSIAFTSCKLQLRECRYSTIERGCLANSPNNRITKFQEYLYGSEFLLETRCSTSAMATRVCLFKISLTSFDSLTSITAC